MGLQSDCKGHLATITYQASLHFAVGGREQIPTVTVWSVASYYDSGCRRRSSAGDAKVLKMPVQLQSGRRSPSQPIKDMECANASWTKAMF